MLHLERLDPTAADRDALVAFLTENTFPFHMRPTLTRAEADQSVDAGAYRDEEHDSLWIVHEELGRIGFVRLEDLTDPTPLFDLRLAERYRGRGLGVPALAAITTHVFTSMPAVTRFEGQTRADNIAMRRVFQRCEWVKEAHYREAWPVAGGAALASVAYAVLRRDWETGATTPVDWDDLP